MNRLPATLSPHLLTTLIPGDTMNRIIAALFCSLFAVASLAAAPADDQSKINCAVIGVKSAEGVSVGEADIIADRLRLELFNTGRASMMERDQMQDVLKEQGFQQSGACSDEACMVEIGKVLGVEMLVSGSIGKLGKMYLINFRTIDVATARIGAVVSRDISGSIEDVVYYLPAIAQELMGAAPVKDVPPPKAAVVPEPVVSTPPPAPVAAKVESVTDDASGSNRNRGGFRFQYAMLMPGNTDIFRSYQTSLMTDSINLDEDTMVMKTVRSTFVHLQFRGVIKMGPVFALDIGGGYFHYKPRYYTSTANFIDFNWNVPAFGVGINFTKRFAPVKLNIGPLMDIGLGVLSVSANNTTEASTSLDVPWISAGLFLSPGARAGIEFLASPKVGFNFDALWRYNKVSVTHPRLNTDGSLYDLINEDHYTLAGSTFGVAVGINLYK